MTSALLIVLGMTATTCIYSLMLWLHRRYCPYPWAHPLVLTVSALTLGLFVLNIPIEAYQVSTQAIHWFLGPMTVALAIPVYQQWYNLKKMGSHLLLSVIFGGGISPYSGMAIRLAVSRTK